MRNSKRTAWQLALAVSCAIGLAACDTATTPTNTIRWTLDLQVYRHAEELTIDSSLTLKAVLVDARLTPQRGLRVEFIVDPASAGEITPYGVSEPDSATGFSMPVMLTGRREGMLMIRGSVLDGSGNLAAWDTVTVEVKAPING